MAEKATTRLMGSLDEVRWDIWLATATIGLVVFGTVMIYSASGYVAQERFGDAHHFLVRQVAWGLLGLVFFFPARNHAHRWISFGSWASAQPSEMAKIALGTFLARFLSVREQEGETGNFLTTVIPASVVTGGLAVLIIKEPDLGTTLMLGAIFLAMMFASGVRVLHLLSFTPLLLVAFYFYIFRVGWRWD